MRSPPVLRLLSMALARDLTSVDWPRETMAVEGPPRGVPALDPASCTSCGECAAVCPAGCIGIDDGGAGPVVDAGACVRCSRCIDACGEGAITLKGETVMAAYSRGDLVMDGSPPDLVEADIPPSRLYRMSVDGDRRVQVEPRDLLEARHSRLTRRPGGREDG